MHGGKKKRGMDSPNAIHGLRSEYMDDETREIYEQVSQQSNAELVQEEIWAIKARLLRAAKESGNNEAIQLVREILDDQEAADVDQQLVDALAKMLQTSSGALDRALGRMNDLVKTHHKITEGDSLDVTHSGEVGQNLSGGFSVEINHHRVGLDGEDDEN